MAMRMLLRLLLLGAYKLELQYDVGRVLEMPYGQVDQIAKLIPIIPANPITLSKALETQEELSRARIENEEVSKLIDISLSIEGLNRHVSTHAAGIVIAESKLDEFIPLYSEKERGNTCNSIQS